MYSHGTFRADSPPSRGATPPGIGTPPRAATPPTSRQGVSPRFARSPQATPVISVTPLPSEEASLPPPPAVFIENQPPTLHPAPPTPPPPPSPSPQGAPLAPSSNPITNPTPDTLSTTILSPPDQSKLKQPKDTSSVFEEDAHDHPNDPYRPNDVQSTKL